MSTTITWDITSTERLCATGEIQTLHYTISAVTDDNAYRTGAYGSINLDPADPEAMLPYADITPEVAIQWLHAKLGEEKVTEIEDALSAALEEKRAPTRASGLPWAT